MDLIAQTRAVLEDEESDDKRVSAESSAHSLDTHKNVYIDRPMTYKNGCRYP